jgi:predicted CoA-binding protein
MSHDSCPVPPHPRDDERAIIQRLLRAQRIAVVGLSDDPSRPSYGVAAYLIDAGRDVIPVNPNHATVLGRECYARLEDVPGPIDLVDVFRRPEYCAEVARSAVAVGAKGVWLQSGIRSVEARRIAEQAGVDYVEDRCLMVEHRRADTL